MKTSTLPLLVLAGMARAATHTVEAGNLYFEPNSTTAAVGDVVEFTFMPQNHSVAAGDYDNPCQLSTSGSQFFSGYVPVTSGESRTVFRITLNNTDPIWLYCTQGDHCREGMVGVINPPAATSGTGANETQSLANYAAAAANFTDTAGDGTFMYGGTLSTITNDTSDASGTSAAPTSTSTSSTGAADGKLRVAPVGAVVAGALGLAAWGMA